MILPSLWLTLPCVALAVRPPAPQPDTDSLAAGEPGTLAPVVPLPAQLPEVPDDPLDAVRERLSRNDVEGARQILSELDPVTRETSPLLRDLVDAGPTQGDVVGLLIPSEGRWGGVGRMLREAFLHGVEASAESEPARRPRVVAIEVGEDATSARAATVQLLREHRPGLLVGPIVRDQVEPLRDLAEQAGVPLLGMHGALSPDPQSRWIFDGWLSTEQQIRALVDHLFESGEARRFAALGPESDFARRAIDTFAEQVEARGGELVERRLYPEDTTDFRDFASAFVGRDRMPPPPRPKPGEKPSKVKGPPLLQVDAVFIADGARRAPLVAAGLAHEELAMGKFTPHDQPPARLVGLSQWNDASLLASGGAYFHGAWFTDVFVPRPPSGYTWRPEPGWHDFVESFRATYDRNPRPLEAMAWDLGRVAAQVAKPGASRDQIRVQLTDAEITGTLTGLTGFRPEDQSARRPIRIVEVQPDGFALVPPPEPADEP